MKQRFPDFIIAGAPKCGTTSLHFVLKQHPDIGMPDDETHYFDADDPIAHADFFFHENGNFRYYDNSRENATYREYYAAQFRDFVDYKLIGEDSPSYIFSDTAPPRIQALLPNVKLIFMLRNPIERAYSQYWHLVRTARVSMSFAKAVHRHPTIVLGSTYMRYLSHYRDVVGPDRMKVVLFEDYVADRQGIIDGVTDFLGVDRMVVKDDASWFNKTVYPSNLTAHLTLNRLGRHFVAMRYANHLGPEGKKRGRIGRKLHYLWFSRVNNIFLTSEKKPPMDPKVRAFLYEHLSARNHGLSDFLQRPLGEVWKGFYDW